MGRVSGNNDPMSGSQTEISGGRRGEKSVIVEIAKDAITAGSESDRRRLLLGGLLILRSGPAPMGQAHPLTFWYFYETIIIASLFEAC